MYCPDCPSAHNPSPTDVTTYQDLKRTADERWQTLVNGDKPWIRVGAAMCGQAAGALEVIDALRDALESLGVDAELSNVGCIGTCYAEPLVDVLTPGGSRVFFRNVNSEDAAAIVETYLVNGSVPTDRAFGFIGDVPVNGLTDLDRVAPRMFEHRIALRNAGNLVPGDVDQYIANGGYEALNRALQSMEPPEVLEEIKTSGLRGRGGAAFPTGVKLSFLVGSPGPPKYILCNCEEGDPGAVNDKGILESDPHTLLEGLILSGYATGASNGIVFVRHGHDGPIDSMDEAIRQAYDRGLLGQNILDSEFSFEVEISLTGESYVAGEETALMESIEGKRAMPRFRPPFPAAFGVWGKPSNINNVKTLSYLPEIVAKGGEWFSSIGVNRSTGTAILCLNGQISRPGLYEVPMGLTLGQVIDDIGGGVPNGKKLKLLQTGGPLGGVLGPDAMDITLDFEAMAEAGAILGSGGIIIADEDTCAVDLTRVLVSFCQYESCGKCFPCRLGMTHLMEIVERITKFEGRPGDLELMRQIGGNMQAASLCGHGQLGFNPISSAFKHFEEDFNLHLLESRCISGGCSNPIITPRNTRPYGDAYEAVQMTHTSW